MKTEFYIDPKTLENKSFSFSKAYSYAKLMEEGVEFPAVNIYPHYYHNHLTFNDGRHRVAAARLAGVKLKVRRSVNA